MSELYRELITRRNSCRTFSRQTIDRNVAGRILEAIDESSAVPFGSPVRIGFIDLTDADEKEMKRIGTYGIIKNARVYLAGTTVNSPAGLRDFGYAMERIILHAASLGLGTCWLGGTFSRSAFASCLGQEENEVIPAVTPLGYPAGKPAFTDRVMHLLAGSKHRKSWNELFFEGNFSRPLSENNAAVLRDAFEAVRLAPSAVNRQPWRLLYDTSGEAVHFYCRAEKSASKASFDMNDIDLGIAMCHFDLVARECGVPGSWTVRDPAPESPDKDAYIASWVRRL